jgi:hypothetical protein
MGLVAIDTGRNVRKTVLLTHEEAAAVEAFRVSMGQVLGRVPSESWAIAELIRRALEREQQEKKPAPRRLRDEGEKS